MLFDGPIVARDEDYDPVLDEEAEIPSSLPLYLSELVTVIYGLIMPTIPTPDLAVLFEQRLARQVIINLYPPGEGISAHIDLPHRYSDGIIGVSLCGGCVMVMRHEVTGQKHHVYLPPNTVYCFTGEARWAWTHGIESRKADVVQDSSGRGVTIMRDLRVSVTFRWMAVGADELSQDV
jgi:alkylated DNA repair dioxygenase AlkB